MPLELSGYCFAFGIQTTTSLGIIRLNAPASPHSRIPYNCGHMTDKGMAQDIAEELHRLRSLVDSFDILMTKYPIIDPHGIPVPWRQDLVRLEELDEYRLLVQQREKEISELIGGEEFESHPILAVWKKYCQSRNQ